MMKYNKSLVSLNISNAILNSDSNQLGVEGIRYLVEGLKQNQTLVSLDISMIL